MSYTPLTNADIERIYREETGSLIDDSPWALIDFSRAIEAATTAPLLARIAELEDRVAELTDSECDKIMALSDEQISAMNRQEGRDPNDVATIGKQACQLAIKDVKIAELEAALAELRAEMEGRHKSIIEMGNKLTEIVNLIRGEPEEGTSHSTHDAFELVRELAMHNDLYAKAVESEAARLKAALAEASKDAQRLALVESMSRAMSLDINGNHYWTTQLRDVRGPNFRAALDAAIDATMKGAPTQTK